VSVADGGVVGAVLANKAFHREVFLAFDAKPRLARRYNLGHYNLGRHIVRAGT